MLDEDDLDAAVAEGIVTPAQVEALRAFVGSRRHAAERADDERFRFMRGFNDFFFAVGIVLFAIGIAFFAGVDPIMNLLAAGLIWALAELLVRRMRLVLPGILLAGLFAFFVFRLTELDWSHIAQLTGLPLRPPARLASSPVLGSLEPIAIATKALVTGLAAAAFYARFRLPFALLLIAASLVVLVSTVFGSILFPGVVTPSLILLACGLGVFATAMVYDLSDRMRTTRAADCAFWLHLLAAPLTVHSLIRLIVPATGAAPFGVTMTAMSAAAIFVIVALLTAVAVLIDRRALLVSALTYLGIAIGYALTSAIRTDTGNQPAVFFATFVILGLMVLALGVGWQPLRRLFLRLFPSDLVNRLPPAVSPA
ncbi:MAG TPA: hypothetical protein VMR17_24010 [Xanthobacteraceae bacterium]|jgi:hypothetical protein|nr:hypothetical protein [Xanthobacteraceae bacterium]